MDEVARAYDANAERYTELFGRASALHPDDIDLIDRRLGIPSTTVVDLGCGPGHLAGRLAASGAAVVGLDITRAFLDHARRTRGAAAFVLGSAQRVPLRSGTVTGILAWYSLIHLAPSELDHALAECARLAAPGATIVIGAFDGDRRESFPHRVIEAFTWPADELSARLERAGFVEIERLRRPADPRTGSRRHVALAAVTR